MDRPQSMERHRGAHAAHGSCAAPRAVVCGAGNIGRGFIGQLFSESGYHVTFVDIDSGLVARLNEAGGYTIRLVSDQGDETRWIHPVDAVDGRDGNAFAEALRRADCLAVSVGLAALPHLARPIAAGLRLRWSEQRPPLDILICENGLEAPAVLSKAVMDQLGDAEQVRLHREVGFVETCIGRMVPASGDDTADPLLVRAEPYAELPVARDAFRGLLPSIRGMVPYAPFDYPVRRKLYVHNMGHAVAAWLGHRAGCRFIWEAVGDESVRAVTRGAMLEAAEALSMEYGVLPGELADHVDSLLERFANRRLGDTVERVGRDLVRKLSREDRLIGAMRLCLRHDIEPLHIAQGLEAALAFPDPASDTVRRLLQSQGPEGVLDAVCGFHPGEWQREAVLKALRQWVVV